MSVGMALVRTSIILAPIGGTAYPQTEFIHDRYVDSEWQW